jgi:Cytochrome P450
MPSHRSYMDLVFFFSNESMRLFPAVLSGSQRTVPYGNGGVMVGSQYVFDFVSYMVYIYVDNMLASYIPEGTHISVHPYTMHRDPRYFSPYPEAFWPDRWLAPSDRRSLYGTRKLLEEDINVVTNTAAFMPFSAGPRTCPGKNLAMAEIRVIVSYVVQRFDMQRAKGWDLNEWEKSLKDYFILTKGSLPIVLSPRTRVQ